MVLGLGFRSFQGVFMVLGLGFRIFQGFGVWDFHRGFWDFCRLVSSIGLSRVRACSVWGLAVATEQSWRFRGSGVQGFRV